MSTSSSSSSQLELMKQTLDADRLRLQQVRQHLATPTTSSSSARRQPASIPPPTPAPASARKPASSSSALVTTMAHQENSNHNHNTTTSSSTDVFTRLYESSKRHPTTAASASTPVAAAYRKTSQQLFPEPAFRPQIDARSRALAAKTERASLYDRAKELRTRQASRIEHEETTLHAVRNRSRLSSSSQELSFNPLRKEMEQRFHHHDDNPDDDEEVSREELHAVLLSLGLHEFDIFSRVAAGASAVRVSAVIDYLFRVFRDNDDGDEDELLRQCLVSVNQDIANNVRAQRVRQMQRTITREETPFRPRCISAAKSHVLDEQRMEKLGIDPSLPREEKLLQVSARTKLDQQEARKRWLEKQQAECPFRPTLYSTFTPTPSAAAAAAADVDTSSHNSSSSSSVDGGEESVVNRLYQDSFRRRHRLQELQQERQQHQAQMEVSECTFQPVLTSSRKKPHLAMPAAAAAASPRRPTTAVAAAPCTPPPPPPPSRYPPSSSLASAAVVFQAEVELPSGATSVVRVREGQPPSQAARLFVHEHGLDARALEALTRSLEEAVEAAAAATAHSSSSASMEEEEQEEERVEIDIVVREGETHSIRVVMGQDPTPAARAFAKRHRMDHDALLELIDSLRSVVM